MKFAIIGVGVFVLLLGACAHERPASTNGEPLPYASSYRPLDSVATLLEGATVLTGTGQRLDGADVLMRDGKIFAVGGGLDAGDATSVDASGMWITPGVIDVHSHLGVYASPGVAAHSDGNEMSKPVTAEVWAEHGVWPQDPGFVAALAGGVTSIQILPGSGNLIGGRGVTLKNVPGRDVMDMKFPGAPHGLKMACGENPKSFYGGQGQSPMTRMGNVAGYRAAWIEAADYRDEKAAAEDGTGEAPTRDLKLETLAGVLDGEILVHNHCYRADEMSLMLDVAREFGYRISTFHHAVEAYKIADLLAENDVCAAVWADWWGFKMESYDGIRENAAILDRAGACAVIHSDDEIGIQRLNQEAAKVMGAAAQVDLQIPPERAIQWITRNAAKSLGILEQTGTLEPGKMADVVVWDGNPFSVYTRVERVYIDGALAYDRSDPELNPVSDFSLGTAAISGGAR
ncbi:MAG: amidohydrolase [Deltaproteobacteria bacterium]|jgi:imidazolonepropionase-like amidohydrolase|nr:amidohydrolase [Deltaproteobacteria bacterium]